MEHIAIMNSDVYITKILNGEKIIESRFSKNKITPFNKIKQGDIVYLKSNGKNIMAKFEVDKVLYFENINTIMMEEIENKYNNLIVAPKEYWDYKRGSKYGTLIYIKNPQIIDPIKIIKKNRQAFISVENIKKDVLIKYDKIEKGLCDCENNHHLVKYINKKLCCEKCNYFNFNQEVLATLPDYNIVKKELYKSKWNYDWFNANIDNVALNHLNISDNDIIKILKKSVFKLTQKDGKQTPFTGNIVYYAQHSTATCCRKCMEKWYNISREKELTEEEKLYFLSLIKNYILEKTQTISKHFENKE